MFRNFRCFLLLSFVCSPQKKEMNENISFHVTSLAKLIQLLPLVYDIISILYIRYLYDLVTFCVFRALEWMGADKTTKIQYDRASCSCQWPFYLNYAECDHFYCAQFKCEAFQCVLLLQHCIFPDRTIKTQEFAKAISPFKSQLILKLQLNHSSGSFEFWISS